MKKKSICYLCGKPGADSKDRVPPKCLLPESAASKYQRLTIPAHRECNSATSDDEEYVRDLLIQEAKALEMESVDQITEKVWRSWSKSGWNRYQQFMKKAKLLPAKTSSGIYRGKVLAVEVDLNKVKTVCNKVARGIIFKDSGAVLNQDEVTCVPLSVPDATREREENYNQPFWMAMASDGCIHNMFADTVAIRRCYEMITIETGTNKPRNEIVCHVGIMAWNLFGVCTAIISFERIKNEKLKLVVRNQKST